MNGSTMMSCTRTESILMKQYLLPRSKSHIINEKEASRDPAIQTKKKEQLLKLIY